MNRSLTIELEAAQKSAKEDEDMLKNKNQMLEKLKRDIKQLEKENIKLQKRSSAEPITPSSLSSQKRKQQENARNNKL